MAELASEENRLVPLEVFFVQVLKYPTTMPGKSQHNQPGADLIETNPLDGVTFRYYEAVTIYKFNWALLNYSYGYITVKKDRRIGPQKVQNLLSTSNNGYWPVLARLAWLGVPGGEVLVIG